MWETLICWNHIIRDLLWYLKDSCNCTSENVNSFVNLLRTMMSRDTEEEFDSQLAVAQQDDHFKQNKKVYSYFSNNLIPAIKKGPCSRLGSTYSPHQESFSWYY